MDITIREIKKKDNSQVKNLIEIVMTEFGAVGEGFSIVDPEVKNMYEAYKDDRSIYYVLEKNKEIVGGAGISHLVGTSSQICELKKMYFLPNIRGKGLSSQLITLCLDFAKNSNYKVCYLETLEVMKAANSLYQKFNFKRLKAPLGSTGHHGCNYWYSREI